MRNVSGIKVFRSIQIILILISVAGILSGCGVSTKITTHRPSYKSSADIEKNGLPSSESLSGESISAKYLSDYYADEWALMPATEKDNEISDPPYFGIALSGGGTRSASFCIGILKGLEENKLLEQAQMLSTVSGGSYAGYWLFSKHYYMDKAKIKGIAVPDYLKYGPADIFRHANLYKELCQFQDSSKPKLKDCRACPGESLKHDDCISCSDETIVFCIIEIPKVATRNSPLLQSGIPQFCNERVEGFGSH